jgi:hypothetical protein
LTEIFADLMGQTGFIDCSLHSIAVGLLINFLPLSLWGRDVLMAALCKVHTAQLALAGRPRRVVNRKMIFFPAAQQQSRPAVNAL